MTCFDFQIQILTQDSDYLKKDYDLRIKTLELEKKSIEMKFEYQRNHDFGNYLFVNSGV